MINLDIISAENSVPEGFVDWVKIGMEKQLPINQRVEQLLSENMLEDALDIFDKTLHQDNSVKSRTHKGNDRIH